MTRRFSSRRRRRAALIETLRKGRVRYLITCVPANPALDERYGEMKLAHGVATSRDDLFRKIGEVPMLVQLGFPGRTINIFVWEFLGDLPEGLSELL